MFCSGCGTEIANNSKFCGSCGAELSGNDGISSPTSSSQSKKSESIKKEEAAGGFGVVISETFRLVTKETDLNKLWLGLLYFTIGNEVLGILLSLMGALPQELGVSAAEMLMYGLAGLAAGVGILYFIIKVQAIGKNKPSWAIAFFVLGVLGYLFAITSFISSASEGYQMPGGMLGLLVIYQRFIGGAITLLLSYRIMKALKKQ
jgi:hypothetical protein